MDRRYRKTIIAGNWKMNGDISATKAFFKAFKNVNITAKNTKHVICLPNTLITTAVNAAKGTRIAIGGQNMHNEAKGAFTGEVSGNMLTEVGAEYVILGHSERRQYFGDTDEIVSKKVASALSAGLRPIVCVGETLCQRNYGITEEVVRRQLKVALADVDVMQIKKITVAYEPVWAIGTGKTALPAQAQEVCHQIRSCIRELYDAKIARAVSILYGGSMNEKNAHELLSQYDIDGGLIGGASLNSTEFLNILTTASKLS